MISLSNRNPSLFKGDVLVYFARQVKKGPPVCSDDLVQKRIDRAYAVGDFKGKKQEILLFYPERVYDGVQAKRLLVIGLGDGELDRETFRLAGGAVAKQAIAVKALNVFVVLPEELEFSLAEMSECLGEGVLLGKYQFSKYKKQDNDDKPVAIKRISFYAKDSPLLIRKGIKKGVNAAEAGSIARDMANEPGNVWTPTAFANFAKKLAKDQNLKCKVIEKAEMNRLKMGGILGVSQGSAEAPKLVVLQYRTGKDVPTLMLVGKGLTFDSGGISLKPAEKMEDMKYDMCGGAAVLAAMQAIGSERPKYVDVVALVPASDNLPSGTALKPGDIITQYGGNTVEVINTDAEGRLILADALAYGVEKFKPDAVVDVATLTGAVILGLGHHRTGLLANNDELADKILKAGERSGEPLWRLPLADEYREQIKSEVADMKNVGGRPGGTITAAAFLEKFIGETTWAHLDIAGTAWNYTEKSYIPKGPSGIAARTLIELVRSWK